MTKFLEFADIRSALKFLRGRVGDRKFRLLAVAACRHVYPVALKPEWSAAVDVVERFADAEADRAELAQVQSASHTRAQGLRDEGLGGQVDRWMAWQLEETIRSATQTSGFAAAWTCVAAALHGASVKAGEEMRFAPERMGDLLEEICGDCRWQGTFLPAWRTPDAVQLASAIYRAKAFADLPVLADALEEAGCADPDLLGHLRSQGLHARGCWPLDLILGRS